MPSDCDVLTLNLLINSVVDAILMRSASEHAPLTPRAHRNPLYFPELRSSLSKTQNPPNTTLHIARRRQFKTAGLSSTLLGELRERRTLEMVLGANEHILQQLQALEPHERHSDGSGEFGILYDEMPDRFQLSRYKVLQDSCQECASPWTNTCGLWAR
jgi:hypothetical protein